MDYTKTKKRLNRYNGYRVKRNRIRLLKDLGWDPEVISRVKGHDKHHPINCGNSECGVCGKHLKKYERRSARAKMRTEDRFIYRSINT